MVLGKALDTYLGLSEMVAMLFAGLVLILLGGAHLLYPATSTIGMIIGAESSLTSVMGIVTRVLGLFVALAGVDILEETF